MEEKTPKEIVVDFFKALDWPEMVFEDSKISCPSGDMVVFNGGSIIINFHFYNRLQNRYEKRNNRQTLVMVRKEQST